MGYQLQLTFAPSRFTFFLTLNSLHPSTGNLGFWIIKILGKSYKGKANEMKQNPRCGSWSWKLNRSTSPFSTTYVNYTDPRLAATSVGLGVWLGGDPQRIWEPDYHDFIRLCLFYLPIENKKSTRHYQETPNWITSVPNILLSVHITQQLSYLPTMIRTNYLCCLVVPFMLPRLLA